MSSELFTPIQVGSIELKHRIALAPLTRFRATKEHVHTVHAKKSFIYLQLWALGRAAIASELTPFPVVSSSEIPLDPKGDTRSKDKPTPLTVAEIKQYAKWYAEAAVRFVKEAGGDGVEIHAANGYLPDQFTQSTCNNRTDEYGGSAENRSRFALEMLKAVTDAVGQERTGIRLSPHSHFQDMKMDAPELKNTFSYLVKKIKSDFPRLAYLHVTEPRVSGGWDTKSERFGEEESIDFIHKIWQPKPIIVAGQYTAESAATLARKYPNAVVAFGRHFIANPDLPLRIRLDIPFHKYNRKTFYLNGPAHPEGYIDQPFATPEAIAKAKRALGGKL